MRFWNILFYGLMVIIALGLTTTVYGQGSETPGAPIHTVTANFSVAPQMSVADIKKAAEEGYTLVINNRPDGEGGPDQPTSAELERAAKEAGIDYVYIPFRSGHLTNEALTQMKEVMSGQKGKTVGFCRSGTRAITIWAMAESALGTMLPEETIKAAHGAGYNLERQRKRLDALAADKNP